MQPAQLLNQLSIQLQLLKVASDLAPLNQEQLQRLNSVEDRLLDLMERTIDAALEPPELPPQGPSISAPLMPAPSRKGPAPATQPSPPAEPSPVGGPSTQSGSAFPFRTTGYQHISELIQAIIPPVIGRGLSFDELSQGVQQVLSDTPGVKTQRPPPGTLLELGGLLRTFEVDPGSLSIEATES